LPQYFVRKPRRCAASPTFSASSWNKISSVKSAIYLFLIPKTNYDELAEDYFLPNPDFNLSEEPVPGITPGNYVGSVPSPFNPAADARFGNWFTPAPYIGAVENEANDWTADGSWCKNQDGTIR
jgi:hypothetical protein